MLEYVALKEDKSPISLRKKYDNFDNLENAGVLLNDNVVLIDFDNDNKNESQIIEYIDKTYPTLKVITDKGVHFYYAKPQNLTLKKSMIDTITVGGFQVDYKTSNKQYAVIKRNGKVRESNRPFSFDNLAELPSLLFPLVRRKDNLSGMVEHDGRNDTLHKHLCSEQRNYADIDIDNIAEIINNIVFTDPLDNTELNSVVDSAKSYYEYNEDTKDMISFAQWVIKELDIKMYNTDLFFLDNNRYISDNKLLIKKITEFLKLKKAQDNELMYQLTKLSDEIDASLKELPILLRNGSIVDGEYVPPTETIPFTPFYLDVEYNASAFDEHVDKFLNSITCDSKGEDPTLRKELRQTLEEVLGHILLTNKFPAHVFFLSGGGNNGKSTFLEMINNFVGELGQNLSLDAFNDGTSVATLNAKLVNCSDETDDVFIDRCKDYKSLASGNTITVRPIYSQPVKVQNTATLILSANKMPEFKDKSKGFFRRLMIIPFDFVITEKISNLDDLLSTDNAKSYILNLALKGVQSIKANGYKMTENKYLNEKIDEYILDTDTVASYLAEKDTKIENRRTTEVHKAYCLYCMDIGKMSLGLSRFSSRLKDFGYYSTPVSNPNKNSKDKTIRVYKKG